MRRIAYITILPLLLLSCRGGKGRVRIEGAFLNLDQASFLIYSPDGGFPDIDTLRLEKGKFRKDIPVSGGPYTFTIVYPNFSTLSSVATERATVVINGDALALADVSVEGAELVLAEQEREAGQTLKVGARLPKTEAIARSRREGKYLLVGFWANWRGGSNVVNTHIRKAVEKHGDKLCALSYCLDVDQRMHRMGEGNDSLAWDTFCDYLAWDSPDVRRLGIGNIPYMLLLDPNGRLVAMGANFGTDIEPSLRELPQ